MHNNNDNHHNLYRHTDAASMANNHGCHNRNCCDHICYAWQSLRHSIGRVWLRVGSAGPVLERVQRWNCDVDICRSPVHGYLQCLLLLIQPEDRPSDCSEPDPSSNDESHHLPTDWSTSPCSRSLQAMSPRFGVVDHSQRCRREWLDWCGLPFAGCDCAGNDS